MIKIISIVFISQFLLSTASSSNTVVSTGSGDIRGYVLDISGHNVVGSSVDSVKMFLGIPYAEPPVGDLRFARPVAKRPWAPRVLDTLAFSPACPQPAWFLPTYVDHYDNSICLYRGNVQCSTNNS